MSVKIHIEPNKTWAFFKDNPDRMKNEMVAIAENEETEYVIYITDDDCSWPLFVVYKGEQHIYEEDAISVEDCEDVAQRLYTKYLFPITISIDDYEQDIGVWGDDDAPPESLQDMEDTIYEREDALYFATTELLEVLLCCPVGEIEDQYGNYLVGEVLDKICEYLNTEQCVSVYRPAFITNDDGEEVFEEYPYGDYLDEEDDNTCINV